MIFNKRILHELTLKFYISWKHGHDILLLWEYSDSFKELNKIYIKQKFSGMISDSVNFFKVHSVILHME